MIGNFYHCTIGRTSVVFPRSVSDGIVVDVVLSSCLASGYLKVTLVRPLVLPPTETTFVNTGAASPVKVCHSFLRRLSSLGAPSHVTMTSGRFCTGCVTGLMSNGVILRGNDIFLRFTSNRLVPMDTTTSSIGRLVPFLLVLRGNGGHRCGDLLFRRPRTRIRPGGRFLIVSVLTEYYGGNVLVRVAARDSCVLKQVGRLLLLNGVGRTSRTSFKRFYRTRLRGGGLCLASRRIKTCCFGHRRNGIIVRGRSLTRNLPFDSFRRAIGSRVSLSTSVSRMTRRLNVMSGLWGIDSVSTAVRRFNGLCPTCTALCFGSRYRVMRATPGSSLSFEQLIISNKRNCTFPQRLTNSSISFCDGTNYRRPVLLGDSNVFFTRISNEGYLFIYRLGDSFNITRVDRTGRRVIKALLHLRTRLDVLRSLPR